MRNQFLVFLFLVAALPAAAQQSDVHLVPVDSGWAKNSVNATIFRKNSIVSFGSLQYITFYNSSGFVVLGKRKLGSDHWQVKETGFNGNVNDAHNVISLMVDGEGFLHIAWNHHNNRLHYVKSIKPGSLELTEELPMTGEHEDRVSYPEFYRLPDGDLLFFYRDGGSGNGNLVINRYDVKKKSWKQLQGNLVDGQDERSAYWQACVDVKGNIHLSWVWRETPDVATNHDLCYAVSKDGGNTWLKSTGEKYSLPITADKAEYAMRIPQQSELINQTSMFADDDGRPYIATYWKEADSQIPQYHLVYKDDHGWKKEVLDFRKTPFTLSGAGTKRIPISRPQIVAWQNGDQTAAALIFRDEERGSKVSVALNTGLETHHWKIIDLTKTSVGSWEPSYDTELWKRKKLLHLFVQQVEQADAEGRTELPAQMVEVLEWNPKINLHN